jgi:hypothetical protein
MTAEHASAYVVEPYRPSDEASWDAFLRASKNGTFLFARSYMDYHSDRFRDHSLVVRAGGEVVALLPANRVGDEVHSHQGLTYGGLVTSDAMTTPAMLAVLGSVVAHLRAEGIRRLHYKTVPWIYHRIPAEEDRYALFRADAVLTRRDVLVVIPAGRRGPVQARRRRGAAKAARHGVVVAESADWGPYWAMLTDHIQARYGVPPVHSLAEIELLASRFPHGIRLFTATRRDEVLAGVVIFESAMVAHVQYIGSSGHGRETGALDAVFLHLLEGVFADKPYFDFGISNEQQGRILNRGLIEQKEGFGARAVVHDFYEVDVAACAS